MDGTHAHIGHEIAGEKAPKIAEKERHKQEQTNENQCVMLPIGGNEVQGLEIQTELPWALPGVLSWFPDRPSRNMVGCLQPSEDKEAASVYWREYDLRAKFPVDF